MNTEDPPADAPQPVATDDIPSDGLQPTSTSPDNQTEAATELTETNGAYHADAVASQSGTQVPAEAAGWADAPAANDKMSIFSGRVGPLRYAFNLQVFIASAVVIWGFVIWCLVDDKALPRLADLQDFICEHFSWLFVGAVCSFIIFMVYLFLHPVYGNIKLGAPDDEPEYSLATWYAMLFCAGYGPAIWVFGVAESVMHFKFGYAFPLYLNTNSQYIL